jgi:Co/Zn/Cd efflux system component
LNERDIILDGHIQIRKSDSARMESIKKRIKSILQDKYHIGHSTLEFETENCGNKTC